MLFQVLHHGKVVEFDRPDVLLSNSASHFSLLVKQTSPAESEYLHALAKQKKTE